MNKPKVEHPKTQNDKFTAAAKELGCNESESAFNKNLGKLATAPALKAKPQKKK